MSLLEPEPSRSIMVREALDRGTKALASNRDVNPVVRAYLEDALARVYLSMGRSAGRDRLVTM